MSYEERLRKVIPGGAHTYSRGSDQFPKNAPQILERGLGAYVWSPEGKCYLDYGMALRSVALGYAYPSVNEAAMREVSLGNNLTRASLTELTAAEQLVDLIPSFDMVKFSKNGSNATSAAVKIARAYTGKKYICIPKQHPFFSFDDWFIGSTPMTRGIPQQHVQFTLLFDYGNIQSLENLFQQYPDDIAGVMLEPATTLLPCSEECVTQIALKKEKKSCEHQSSNFLHKVQSLCRQYNSLFILDEMITGFRWHLRGAQSLFGVEPDLSTFGKAMANGFSVAAVGGRRDVMEVGSTHIKDAERTFLLSTTHGGEMCGLGAFIETLSIYRQQDVCSYLWQYSHNLKKGFIELIKLHQLEDYISLEGAPIAMNYITRDQQGEISLGFRTLFSQEMVRHGILMPWIAVSLAHGENELQKTLNAVDKALVVYKKALKDGIEQYLEGPSIKPVFRKFN